MLTSALGLGYKVRHMIGEASRGEDQGFSLLSAWVRHRLEEVICRQPVERRPLHKSTIAGDSLALYFYIDVSSDCL